MNADLEDALVEWYEVEFVSRAHRCRGFDGNVVQLHHQRASQGSASERLFRSVEGFLNSVKTLRRDDSADHDAARQRQSEAAAS